MNAIYMQVVTTPSKAMITIVFLLFLDYPNETVNGDSEDPAFFSTMVCCSLVNFA